MSDIDGSFASKRHDYGEDCSSCRMVSGFGMIGMGIYVLTAAKKQKTQLNRNFVYFISVGKFNNNLQPICNIIIINIIQE